MRSKNVALLSVAGSLLATLCLGTAPAGAAPAARATSPGCTGFSLWRAEGRTEGEICGTYATGWVRDDKADGRCPFTRFSTQFSDENVDGPQVGPKGAVRNFTVYPPGGDLLVRWASIEWRSC